jgi:hypothetical protein
MNQHTLDPIFIKTDKKLTTKGVNNHGTTQKIRTKQKQKDNRRRPFNHEGLRNHGGTENKQKQKKPKKTTEDNLTTKDTKGTKVTNRKPLTKSRGGVRVVEKVSVPVGKWRGLTIPRSITFTAENNPFTTKTRRNYPQISSPPLAKGDFDYRLIYGQALRH